MVETLRCSFDLCEDSRKREAEEKYVRVGDVRGSVCMLVYARQLRIRISDKLKLIYGARGWIDRVNPFQFYFDPERESLSD